MNIFETLISGMSKIQTALDNKINAAWDYTKEIGAIITEGLVLKNHIINDEDGDLYRVFTDDEIVPVRHPDLSTQPSILPFRFGTFSVKEVLSIVKPGGEALVPFDTEGGLIINTPTDTHNNLYFGIRFVKGYSAVYVQEHYEEYPLLDKFGNEVVSSDRTLEMADGLFINNNGFLAGFKHSDYGGGTWEDEIFGNEDGGDYVNKNIIFCPDGIVIITATPAGTSDLHRIILRSDNFYIKTPTNLYQYDRAHSYYPEMDVFLTPCCLLCSHTTGEYKINTITTSTTLPELPSKAKPILAEAFNDDNIAPATLTKVNNVWQIGELPFTPEWVRVQYYGGDDYYYYEEKDDGEEEVGIRFIREDGVDVTNKFINDPTIAHARPITLDTFNIFLAHGLSDDTKRVYMILDCVKDLGTPSSDISGIIINNLRIDVGNNHLVNLENHTVIGVLLEGHDVGFYINIVTINNIDVYAFEPNELYSGFADYPINYMRYEGKNIWPWGSSN